VPSTKRRVNVAPSYRPAFTFAIRANTAFVTPFTACAGRQDNRGSGAPKAAALASGAAAERYAATVLPMIREVRKAGAQTLREIAEALNARGVQTARGGQWYATTVKNVLARA
jgi:Recombinase